MKKKIESYQGAAGGWGAVKSVANAVRKQMDIRQDVIAMFDMNKPEGFDCPGCAWPDPKHSASFDICENGAKAIAWEVTDKQVNASFFAENTVQSLLTWGDHELEAAGRLTQPLKYDAVSDCYKPLSWQQAFDEIGARLQSYSDPNQVEFYTSGRTSNEAAFLYQLFAREYGSNNFPDCSNMCHEPTSVGLAASIGVGKGTVLLEDFEKCDLVICIGHNPGTNHPRMLTSLRALVKRGAKMIAINPLQERGLERFTAPQNPFEMLTNSETQLASAYYNVRIGGDMALLKGMMRLLIERDDAASAAGRPSLLDDEFIQTHTVGFDELRRDVLNSEWKDIERISGLSQTQIAELADAYAAAERTIICYGMGITQHEHGTQNVQQLVNLLLMKGNIGKPGAGNGDDSGDASYHKWLPAGSLKYAMTDAWNIYLAAGRGFETPTINELSYRADGQSGMNLGLKPSTNDTIEIGSKTRIGDGLLSLALFQTDTDDEIVVDSSSGGRTTYKNAGKTRRQGAELAWDQRFAGDFRVNASWTWLDATYRSNVCNEQDCNGNRMPGIARNMGFASIGYVPEDGWYAGTEARYMGDIMADDENTAKVPSYTLVGLFTGYKYNYHNLTVDLFGRVDNLFDKEYVGSVIVNESNGRYYEPSPGRNYGVGMNIAWRFE
ncbi:FdhF/YdeP family oxidoreductase [Escherichia coli]|uniref:FdhF/YdeP family oxidoreductase n=1 Tax=Escherichia coli TaxID=562 RepID=UPI000BE5A845|nr:FdhF/YdeP family oxidoreductase [Escherichia coli]